jgi:peptidoglycan/xylan/chitin deacetylase (PgdA/CDA1 family)
MYHSVRADAPPGTHRLSVHPTAFAQQLDVLREQGCTTVTFAALGEALRSGSPLPERTVVLTFDDGYADFHEQALPLLDSRGFTATVFVTTGWLDDAGEDAAGRPLDRMLSWGQVRECAQAGIEIGAHSHSHAQLDQVPAGELREELRRSKDLLETRGGSEVTTLAYPFGYSSRRVREEVARSGYRTAAAVANTLPGLGSDLMAVPRLTVRRSTDLGAFARVSRGEAVARTYAVDRVLTAGYTVVRRARYAWNRARGRV